MKRSFFGLAGQRLHVEFTGTADEWREVARQIQGVGCPPILGELILGMVKQLDDPKTTRDMDPPDPDDKAQPRTV